MRNRNFNNLESAKTLTGTYFKVGIALIVITALCMFIAGIVVCVQVDIGMGIGYIIASLIYGGFGAFFVYMIYMLVRIYVDGMNDLKCNGIAIDGIAGGENGANTVLPHAKAYETCTNYYLYYVEKDSYLSANNSADGQSIRVVKNVLSALKFVSEEEALRYADYRRFDVGGKWKVVKKDLIIPLE